MPTEKNTAFVPGPPRLSRRALLLGVAAATGGALLSACGGAPATSGATGGVATTAPTPAGPRQMVLASTGASAGEYLKSSINAFQAAHPNTTITQNLFTDQTNYKSTGAQLFASNEAPDAAWYWVEAQSSYNAMVKDKVIVPLDDIWQENGLEGALDAATVKRYTHSDGHRYAVPVNLTSYGILMYNEGLFAKAGITDVARQPTMTQFLGWVEKLRAAGIEPLSAGGKQGSVLGWFYNIYLQRQMDEAKLNKLREYARPNADPAVTYKDPDNLAVLQLMKSFADKKVFAEGDLARSRDEAQGVFLQQRAAIYQALSDDLAALPGQLPEGMKVNWFMHPSLKEGVPMKFLVYDGAALMVPGKSKQQGLAKEFIAFHTTRPRQEALTKEFKALFSRTDISAEALAALAPMVRESSDLRVKIGGSFPWAAANQGQIVNRTFQVLQEILAGSRSPEDAANVQEQEAQKLRRGI